MRYNIKHDEPTGRKMNSKNTIKDFIHYDINETVRAIGGEYTLTKETRMPLQNREVLYITGYAVFDTSCCGAGGCGYAIVPGFIHEWKTGKNESHRYISKVEPIQDPEIRKTVQVMIRKQEMVQEIRFE